jgi:hypothetical protein
VSRAQRIGIGVVVSVAGVGLLIWQVRRAGPDAIAQLRDCAADEDVAEAQ